MSNLRPFLLNMIDPRGRTDRRGLLVVALLLLSLEAVLFALAFVLSIDIDGTYVLPLKLAFLWMGVAATSKRLHDIGLSALWMAGGLVALLFWAMAVALSAFFIAGPVAMEPGGIGFMAAYVLIFVPAVAAALWLHLAPGDAGANRFGPAPVEHVWSEPAPAAKPAEAAPAA